jgi:hypothetical protein
MPNIELASRHILDALFHQLYTPAQVGRFTRASHNHVHVIWHGAVRNNQEHFDGACSVNLLD